MRKLAYLLVFLMLFAAGHALAEAGETLDLTGQTFDSLEEVAARLDAAPGVTEVDLTGAELPVETCAALVERYPGVRFVWSMDAFGVTVDSDTRILDFGDRKVTDFDKLALYLRCFPALERVRLYKTTTTMEARDKLYEQFPDIVFGFTLRVMNKAYTLRSDEVTAFSTLKGGEPPYMTSEQTWFVKFCKDLKALDLGHNFINDLSFMYDAPKLKVLILADNRLTDLTPLGYQDEIEYLELFLNDGITDISPLGNMKHLKDVNLALCAGITDISPLYDLPELERIWLSYDHGVPDEQIERLRELHPDAEIVLRSYGSTGVIYNDDGTTSPSWRSHPRYPLIYHMFNHKEFVGWDYDFHDCVWCFRRFTEQFD